MAMQLVKGDEGVFDHHMLAISVRDVTDTLMWTNGIVQAFDSIWLAIFSIASLYHQLDRK
jgi:hypothetical protein